MENYKILIQFPTRERPEILLEMLDVYLELMEDKENYYINVNCDTDDETMNNSNMIEEIGRRKNCGIVFSDNKTKIEAVNSNIPDTNWDIVLLASDDMKPEVVGYDNIIREGFKNFFPDTDGVLWFSDGYQKRNLNTLCILGRKYYDRFGYIYHPSYKSLWSDNEFTIVANMLNKQRYFDSVIIRHVKPGIVDKPYDDLYVRNQKYDNEDRMNFVKRQQHKFFL